MSFHNDTDTDPVRQLHSNQKSELEQQQLRYYRVYADIGEWILAIVTCQIFVTFAQRVSLLVQGAWLPGMGDAKTIAAVTNKQDSTIAGYLSHNPRTKRHFGRQVYYAFADLAIDGEPPAEVAPVKRIRKRTKKKT